MGTLLFYVENGETPEMSLLTRSRRHSSLTLALPCFALVCTLLNICSVLPEKDGGYRGLCFDKCLGICFVMAFISESRDTTDA